jgi:hypothetical protein
MNIAQILLDFEAEVARLLGKRFSDRQEIFYLHLPYSG